MLTQLSKHCTLSFKPVLPCDYNEEVKVETVLPSVWDLFAPVDWITLNKKDILLNPNDFYNTYFYNKKQGYVTLNFKESKQKQDGTKTELEFKELCDEHKIKYENSSFLDDYYFHFDIVLLVNEKTNELNNLKIDIKGMKSLRRNGPKQNKYFFVELNIEGWLFGGKANFIAIEVEIKKFLIFDKLKLQTYVLEHVQFDKPIVAWPEQSLHRVYIRYPKIENNHCSALSLLNTVDAYLQCGVGKFE